MASSNLLCSQLCLAILTIVQWWCATILDDIEVSGVIAHSMLEFGDDVGDMITDIKAIIVPDYNNNSNGVKDKLTRKIV